MVLEFTGFIVYLEYLTHSNVIPIKHNIIRSSWYISKKNHVKIRVSTLGESSCTHDFKPSRWRPQHIQTGKKKP